MLALVSLSSQGGSMPSVRSHWASFQYIARKLPKGLGM